MAQTLLGVFFCGSPFIMFITKERKMETKSQKLESYYFIVSIIIFVSREVIIGKRPKQFYPFIADTRLLGLSFRCYFGR